MTNNRTQETEEMLDDAIEKIAELTERIADVEHEQTHLRNQVRFLEKLLQSHAEFLLQQGEMR